MTLRGNGRASSLWRRLEQDWHVGAARQARITAREVVSFESSGSIGYDCGVKSDNWEILVDNGSLFYAHQSSSSRHFRKQDYLSHYKTWWNYGSIFQACFLEKSEPLSTGISQLSDFKPRSYPNEPLDSIETTSLAAIRACVAATSCQSCPYGQPITSLWRSRSTDMENRISANLRIVPFASLAFPS